MKNSFTIKKFPAVRKASVDLLNTASRKNMIHAFAEADVTDVRSTIRHTRQSERKYLSLIGYIQFCAAKTVAQQKHIQAYRNMKNQLVIFDDVDISTTIERKIGETKEVLPTIIRGANRKSMFEISEEIKDAKEKEINGSEVFKSIKTYLTIPAFIRKFVFRVLDRSPELMKKKAGTIMITSANAGSSGMLWGVPVASHTLNITIGGITKKPVKKDGLIEEREFLNLTISVDHGIIDGAPTARFIRQFLRLIETEIKMQNIQIKPIGHIKKVGNQFLIEVDNEFLPGLKGLEGFSHAHVVWWGHLSDSTENREKLVLSKLFKKGPEQNGVFSTHAPMRPNPVLISTVKILRIDSEKGIFIPFIDADPGTPVLDIKPYQPMERVKNVTVPNWRSHWPQWQEEAAQFNWADEINY